MLKAHFIRGNLAPSKRDSDVRTVAPRFPTNSYAVIRAPTRSVTSSPFFPPRKVHVAGLTTCFWLFADRSLYRTGQIRQKRPHPDEIYFFLLAKPDLYRGPFSARSWIALSKPRKINKWNGYSPHQYRAPVNPWGSNHALQRRSVLLEAVGKNSNCSHARPGSFISARNNRF